MSANTIRLTLVFCFVAAAISVITLVSCKLTGPHQQWHMEIYENSSALATASNSSQPNYINRTLVDIRDYYDGINETVYVQCPLKSNQECHIHNTSVDTMWCGTVTMDANGGNKEETFLTLILPGQSLTCREGSYSLYPDPNPMVWELVPPWILNVFHNE